MSAEQPKRIGVVLVHGVGEQRRFEHLSHETTQLVLALEQMGYTTSVDPNTTQDAAYLAEQESWKADGAAPLRLDVRHKDSGARFTILVHEVWWADLDNKDTLRNQIKFWFWGLGMWNVRLYDEPSPEMPGAGKMDNPKIESNSPWSNEAVARFRLFGFAVVFLLSLGTLSFINYVLGRLKLGQLPGANVLYQYVADVKLYQDRKQHGQGALTDLNGPRRVAIRRRVVRTLVDVYEADYDHWYLLAHSLGTVVAWNGLMETSHCLPNYLSEAMWKRVSLSALAKKEPNPGPTDLMQPARPVWITDPTAAIDRRELFAKLRGFVTYGSPLDKFAFLWPQIVNINHDKTVWPEKFEWLNVYDPTDPVAAELTAFQGAMQPHEVKNYAYRASRILLYSHIQYLRASTKNERTFAVQLMNWILSSDQFVEPTADDSAWYGKRGPAFDLLWRGLMWSVALVCMLMIVSWLIPKLLPSAPAAGCNAGANLAQHADLYAVIQHYVQTALDWGRCHAAAFAGTSCLTRMSSVLVSAFVIVLLTGLIRRYVERRMDA